MNNKIKWVIGIIIIGIIIWFGFLNKSNEPKSNEPIKIGILAPLTGEAASWGENFLAGAELAKKEINDKGGIDGRLINLVIEDSHCKSAVGVSAIDKLINLDKVDVIAGPVCSSVGGAVLPIIQSNAIPSIIIASAPNLTSIGDYIFRDYPSDAFQGKLGAEFIYNKLSKRKAAVVYVKNDWGQGLRDEFTKRFKELGGKVVYDEGINQDSNDLRTQISKIKVSGADVLYIPIYPANAISGLKQIKELSLGIPVVGSDSLRGEEVLSSPGAEGVMFTTSKFNNPEEFIQKIHKLPGKENLAVGTIAPIGYDIVNIFAKVIKSSGVNANKIKNSLDKLHYISGISSLLIEFDKIGDLKNPQSEIMIVKSGKAVPLGQ